MLSLSLFSSFFLSYSCQKFDPKKAFDVNPFYQFPYNVDVDVVSTLLLCDNKMEQQGIYASTFIMHSFTRICIGFIK